jgi:hypothetical protein
MANNDKPAIRFHVTAERMAAVELGELLDLQDAPNDVRRVAAFMARFVADAAGNYLEGEAATAAVRKVTIGQLKGAFEQVTGEMVEVAAPNA